MIKYNILKNKRMEINMKISKKDAIQWLEFFTNLDEDEELLRDQQEILLATFAQIEEAIEYKFENMKKDIKGIKNLENRTLYVGDDEKFSRGCKSCLLGTGLTAIRKTNRCNIECKFCYNFGELNSQPPIGSGMWEIGGSKYYEKDIDLLLNIQKKPTGVCYVYLEPFIEIEKYYPVIKKFSEAGVYQHMYTNGTLATEENLKALGEAGLNELRFNLGATNCSGKVIENIALAKKYIKAVGIETPMTPEFFKMFFEKKEDIFKTSLDFINCAELHLNENNIYNYEGEPMYISRQGYISPTWSRKLTLEFMKIADEEHWPFVIHDCSNHTKFARGLNLCAKEGKWFGSNNYACEFSKIPYEFFLNTLSDESFNFLEEEELPKRFYSGGFDL